MKYIKINYILVVILCKKHALNNQLREIFKNYPNKCIKILITNALLNDLLRKYTSRYWIVLNEYNIIPNILI